MVHAGVAGTSIHDGLGIRMRASDAQDDRVKAAVEEVQHFRLAAAEEDAAAQYALGKCLADGMGVAKDAVEAVRWFRLAAAQEHADAQYALGKCLADGMGVARDVAEAVRWYKLAAAQEHADARYALGNCLLRDSQGVAMDAAEAVRLFGLAAAQGHADARLRHNFYLKRNRGVAEEEVGAPSQKRRTVRKGIAGAV